KAPSEIMVQPNPRRILRTPTSSPNRRGATRHGGWEAGGTVGALAWYAVSIDKTEPRRPPLFQTGQPGQPGSRRARRASSSAAVRGPAQRPALVPSAATNQVWGSPVTDHRLAMPLASPPLSCTVGKLTPVALRKRAASG